MVINRSKPVHDGRSLPLLLFLFSPEASWLPSKRSTSSTSRSSSQQSSARGLSKHSKARAPLPSYPCPLFTPFSPLFHPLFPIYHRVQSLHEPKAASLFVSLLSYRSLNLCIRLLLHRPPLCFAFDRFLLTIVKMIMQVNLIRFVKCH